MLPSGGKAHRLETWRVRIAVDPGKQGVNPEHQRQACEGCCGFGSFHLSPLCASLMDSVGATSD